MRQVSWIGTVLLVGAAIAVWIPLPVLVNFQSARPSATVEPSWAIFFLVNELILGNPSLKLITTVFFVWAALGLLIKTAAATK